MASQDLSATNFGLLIAYVIPGFIALKGLPDPTIAGGAWNSALPDQTVAGLLAESIQAVFAGLTISTVRWLFIDSLHHRTGLRAPAWDFAQLNKSPEAFNLLIQIHYRYYKFYANTLVALIWASAYGVRTLGWKIFVYWLLAGLFYLGSRDSLRKYYDRTGMLLATSPK